MRLELAIMWIIKRPMMLSHAIKQIESEVKKTVSENVDSIFSQAEKH
jgi:hypothetical protein